MTKSLPNMSVPTPRFITDLVPLPYQEDILLCPQTQTRWKKDPDGSLERDLEGEASWEEMGKFVNKTYSQVFIDSYRHALKAKNR